MRRTYVFGFALLSAASAGVLAVVACGGSGTAAGARPDTGTGGGDTGMEVDAGATIEGGDAGDRCGNGPWVSAQLQLIALSLGDAAPISGVAFTSPLCPQLVWYSDDAGRLGGEISRDVPFYGTLERVGYLPELAPEESFDADQSGITFDMLPTLFGAFLVPPFSTTSTTILISVRSTDADAGSCSQPDGVVLAVTGHPEAQITYYTTDTVPVPIDGGTATSARGLATISGLAPSQLVTLTGAKPGCHVTLASGSLTGRVRVEAGFLSLTLADVSP
jgi:hypothetical protein